MCTANMKALCWKGLQRNRTINTNWALKLEAIKNQENFVVIIFRAESYEWSPKIVPNYSEVCSWKPRSTLTRCSRAWWMGKSDFLCWLSKYCIVTLILMFFNIVKRSTMLKITFRVYVPVFRWDFEFSPPFLIHYWFLYPLQSCVC